MTKTLALRYMSVFLLLAVISAGGIWYGWQRLNIPAPGLAVTPIASENQPSYVNHLLGMHTWAFEIGFNHPVEGLDCQVFVREKGQVPVQCGGIGVDGYVDANDRKQGYRSRFDLVVEPAGYDLERANQMRTAVSCSGCGALTLAANPFRGYTSQLVGGDPVRQSDGSYLLMAANKTAPISWPPQNTPDVELVMVAKPYFRKPPVVQ